MGDHELDRRYADTEFKLKITSQIAEVKANLDHNTIETQAIKDKVEQIHEEIERTLHGMGRADTGLVGQTLDNALAIEDLKSFIKKWLPFVAIITVLFADQLSPIIRDFLYQKTKLKIFYSAAQDFKEKKSISRVKHIHIHIEAPKDGDVDVPSPHQNVSDNPDR